MEKDDDFKAVDNDDLIMNKTGTKNMMLNKFGIPQDQIEVVYRKAEEEFSFDTLQRKFMQQFNNHYSHYETFVVLLAFISTIGLYLTLLLWESTFNPIYRTPDVANPLWHQEPGFVEAFRAAEQVKLLILITTLFAMFITYHKHQTRLVWE